MKPLTPENFYYFYPYPKHRVLKYLVLIDSKTGNAKAIIVRKVPKS